MSVESLLKSLTLPVNYVIIWVKTSKFNDHRGDSFKVVINRMTGWLGSIVSDSNE